MCIRDSYDTLLFQARQDSQIILHNQTHLQSPSGENLIPLGESNLIYKAIDLVRSKLEQQNGMDVWITKRIPTQAGLGGASGNAAGALLAANWMYDGRLEHESLTELAGELGSDVPFFLFGGTARCLGRGERVTPLKSHSGIPVVLAKPPVGLSTAKVFDHCTAAASPVSSKGLLNQLSRGQPALFGKQMFNRLEMAASELTDWISRLKSTFTRLSCHSHQMSGSGSTYFGVFSTRIEAQRAANCLSNQHRDASIFACETLCCPHPHHSC